MSVENQAKIIGVANIKGGSGKSTTSMNLAAGLVTAGHPVFCVDCDDPQYTLKRYITNRTDDLAALECASIKTIEGLERIIDAKKDFCEYIIIDTPGSLNELNSKLHSMLDLLITPMNDSLLDLDLIVRVVDNKSVLGPYGQFIWDIKKDFAMKGKKFNWIIFRNRLSSLYNKNKAKIDDSLRKASKLLGFELLSGLSERVIYKNAFDAGVTVFDLDQTNLTSSQVMAKHEIRMITRAILDAFAK